MQNSRALRFLFSAAILIGFSTAAFGQATRTWVSGVGDDANPCSRTAPCKTFAGAMSKTAEGGEIDVLDPGGFGVVTIPKAITLDGTHGAGFGSILNAGTNGINVNVSPTAALHPNDAVVILRNLSIQGTQGSNPGINGINYIRAQRVFVYDCHIQNQSTTGINMNVNVTSTLFVHDTDLTNVGTGIALNASGGQLGILQANHLAIQGNVSGIVLNSNAFGFVTESFLARNTGGSAMQAGNGCTLDVSHTKLYSNTTAINALAGSTIRINENELFDNTNGFAGNAASFQSGGNNKLVGNTSSLTATGPALINQ